MIARLIRSLTRIAWCTGFSAAILAAQSCPSWSPLFDQMETATGRQSVAQFRQSISQAGSIQAFMQAAIQQAGGPSQAIAAAQQMVDSAKQQLADAEQWFNANGAAAASIDGGRYQQNEVPLRRDFVRMNQGLADLLRCYAGQSGASRPGLRSGGVTPTPGAGIAGVLGQLGTKSSPSGPLNGQIGFDRAESTASKMPLPGDNSTNDSLKTNDAIRSMVAGDDLANTLDLGSSNATTLVAAIPSSDSSVASAPLSSPDAQPDGGTRSELSSTLDGGPWTDPLSAQGPVGDVALANGLSGATATSSSNVTTARDDGSTTAGATGQGQEVLGSAVAEVMKQGISQSGEVGETAVAFVDNLDNWGKFYSSDSSTQISGAVGVVKDFNSQFNTNPLSNAVSGQMIGVVGAVAQQENKILGDIDQAMQGNASAAQLDSDVNAVPSSLGKALIPGYQKVENLQIELENATQNLQSRIKSGIQSINMFLYGTKGCVPFTTTPGCP